MLQLLVIGCGGAVGALMRYGLGLRITVLTGSAFPWGTLFVNIVGCFLAGLLLTLFVTRIPLSDLLRNGLQIGLVGGFTTFFGVFHRHHCSVRSGFVVPWFVVHCYKRDRISTRCIPGNECRTELFIVKP